MNPSNLSFNNSFNVTNSTISSNFAAKAVSRDNQFSQITKSPAHVLGEQIANLRFFQHAMSVASYFYSKLPSLSLPAALAESTESKKSSEEKCVIPQTNYYLSDEKRRELEGESASDCNFCDEKILGYQTFYENDKVIALYTHKPYTEGHCLIIPKRHAQRFEDLTDEESVEIFRVIKRVNKAVQSVFGTSAYAIIQKNGKEVGQSVPHVHFHYIPAKEDSWLSWLYVKAGFSYVKGPISKEEMQSAVTRLKAAMNLTTSTGRTNYFGGSTN